MNNFAISSGGIGEALERSASSLMAANNTIDESIALITAANTVVQDPEAVGTAFKTISMRIRGAKTELEEAGLETDGMVESTAKLREEILALTGVDIMDGANSFKSTYKIMDELAAKWQDLTDIQQATVTELIAGKRQGNIVSSLMTNFDTARDALETSLNSSGSAMKEHEKWQKSLEAQILKVKASWQSLSQAFLSSDFLHRTLNGVINLTDGITKLIDTLGTLPTLLTTIATGMSLFKNKGIFKTLTSDLNGFSNSIGIANKSFADLTNAFKFGSANGGLKGGLSAIKNSLSGGLTKSDIANIQAYNKEIESGTSAQTAWYRTMQTSSKSAQDLVASANGSTVALNGMKAATIGSKAALIGAKVAAVAFNAALTMGISLLINWAVSGIQKLINAKKELAEEVDEITSKFKEQSKELQKLKGDYDTTNESSMISKYDKLSRGVDHLGRNISLTADEYSEYQSIVNKIAEQFPKLINGYDSQGNALLSCKGNVEELTAAYEKLIHVQNQEILSNNAADIEKDWQNTLKQANGYDFWEKVGNWLSWDGIFGGTTDDFDMKTDTAEWLSSLTASTSQKDIKKGLTDNSLRGKEIRQVLQNAGFDVNQWSTSTKVSKILKDALENEPEKIKGILDNYYAQFDDAVAEYKTKATALLSEAFDISSSISGLNYSNISEELQSIAYQVVNSLDFEFLNDLNDKEQGIEDYVTNMLDQLNSLESGNVKSIEAAFDLQTQFNGDEISYGEYVKGLEDTGKLIDSLDINQELKTQIKLSLGLNEDGIVDEYKTLSNRLVEITTEDLRSLGHFSGASDAMKMATEDAQEFLDSLSSEEISVLTEIIPEIDAGATIEEIKSALNREMMLQGLTFDLNLEVETAGIEALNTALAESVSASGLSSDSIAALKGRYADLEAKGYDLSVLFEETSHGIHLNRQEYNKLEKAYATDKLADVNGDLEEMKAAYDDLGEAIKNTDDPIRKAELYNDRQTLAKKISEAATLAAQYEGLTSAYNDWLAAEAAGQERDMYENVIEGFENVGDEISRGWYDDGTIEFLEMLTGRTDLAGKSAKELKKIYDDLDKSIKYIDKNGKVLEDTGYSVRDFFTVDDEGNATADGVYNFLDAIGKLEEEAFGGKDIVKRDKNGKIISFDFELAGGDEAIAEALGISTELVQIMKRAADDAGFVVSLDGTYKQLADLQNEARESAEYLKSIGKTDFEFDFNSTNLTNLNKQLEEAHKILDDPDFWNKDGTFNFDAKGATEAMQIVSTLQAKIDQLTEEKYGIGLTVEDEKFEESLENLQEYGRTVKTLNQLKLNPEANAEEIKELEGDLEDISKYFANLDEDLKVELGFEADDNWEEVQKKIESGEVKIPTVLDIQANMDKNIETLTDLALLDSGLLSDSEEATIRKKYNVDVKADEVDTSDVDDKVESAVIDGLGNPILSRTTNIEIIAETFGIEDVDNLYSKLEGLDDKTIQAIAEAIGQGNVEALDLAIAGMDGNEVDAVCNALGYTSLEELKTAIRSMQGNTVDAKVNTDGQAQKVWSLQDTIDGLKGKTVDIVTNIKKVYTTVADGGKKKAAQRTGADPDGSGVNGTANVNGTIGRAYKQGSWGTRDSGTALVGELGREVLVRDGRYYTIGDNGAEFIKYQKGDIIFNHVQSEELFKNGKVTSGGGRAKAFVQGTAFDEGTGGGEYGGSAVGSSDKDKTEETFDWIETLISRLERTIDNLDQTVNNVYKSWSDRNAALTDEITEVGKLISNQKSAYDAYMAEADSVGLDESWAVKVRDGTIDIDTITDENLATKIKDYQTWYEKALEAKDAVEELTETEAELYEQRFENVQSYYDGILQGFEHTESMLNEYISQSEAKGHIISKKYYQALIDNEKNNIAELKKEQSDLIAKRDEAVASGAIVKGSQAWYDMCAEIDSVTQAIEEGETSLIEYANAMRDIDWEVFDLIQERISDVTKEANFLIDLMSYDKLFDDNGKLTNKGMATMGLHGQNYNTYMYQADEYAKEVAKLDGQIANGELDGNSKEVIGYRRELIELQREAILNAEDEKQAIKDLVEEGINLELDALQELIDKKNEELESEKDLYEYSQKVKEQTKEIASLEKQMAAYSGDNSEEAKAKVQELKVSLEEAKTNLEETEYDKYLSDTQQMLDSLYEEYELILNERLDNVDGLISDVITEVNGSAATISDTLTVAATNVGTTLSDAMQNIWNGEGDNAKSVLTTYGTNFQNSLTTTNDTLSKIKTAVNKMADISDEDAQKNINSNNTQSSSEADSTKNSVPPKEEPKKEESKKEEKKLSDDTIKGIAAAIWVYGKNSGWGNNPFRENKLTEKIGATNAEKVQDYINKYGHTGQLYAFWIKKGLNLKKYYYNAFASGARKIDETQLAWTQEKGQEFIVRPSDGAILTPVAKGDSVLNAQASSNIWDMANAPTEFIKDNLNLGVANTPNSSNVQNNITQNLDKVVFNLPNVHNYEQLLAEMQKDKNFERLIMSMTIDQIAGKSGLAKNKSIR